MIGELGGQAGMGGVVLCCDQQAAGILIQPVDDPRPADATDTGETRSAMGDQGVDQGAVGVAGGGVNDQSCGLVDDDDIGILVDDREVHFLTYRHWVARLGNRQTDFLAGLDLGRRVAKWNAVDSRLAVQDQDLELGARHIRTGACQVLVESRSGVTDCDNVLALFGRFRNGIGHLVPCHCVREPRRTVQALKVLVIVMGVMIVAAVMVIIVTIINRSQDGAQRSTPYGKEIVLPEGEILDMAAAAGEVTLRYRLSDGRERLIVIDTNRGRLRGTLDLVGP